MSALENVRQYYGETLKTSDDLKTSACCPVDAMPHHIRPIVSQVHPEVLERFYGCGSPIPLLIEGTTILDLGCGTGRDCFVLSKLVGERGRVIGIDMTAEQLDVAHRHHDYHRDLFGYEQHNIEFRHGYIEDLAALGVADNSVDTVVSNCVVNLSPDKEAVFSEIFRVLKPGGELYFSDIFAGQRIPARLAEDPVLRGECLGGALYIEDFRRLMSRLDIHDYRVVASSSIAVEDQQLAGKTDGIDFYSMTIRAFNLEMEDRCEDYGQVAWYKGGIEHAEHAFVLDDHHVFRKGKPMLVCGNTARMLGRSRYGPHFRIDGDESTHYGLFDCSGSTTIEDSGVCC